jgi:hypothetical protein
MFKKLIISSCVIASFSASAQKPTFFIGGGVVNHYLQNKLSHGSSSNAVNGRGQSSSLQKRTVDGSSSSIGGRVEAGMIFDNKHRWTFGYSLSNDSQFYSHGDETFSSKLQETTMSYDHLFPLTSNMFIFGGGTVNVKNNTTTNETLSGSSELNAVDIGYGLRGGVHYKLSKKWSTDLIYQHVFYWSKSNAYLQDSALWNDKSNNYGSLMITANYHF